MDYTAVGQTTHLAARMEQMATPGSILITPETLTLVEGYVVVKPLGPMRVKGLEAPRELYEVVDASPIRSRLHASAVHGLTRFVGRDGETEQLRQALEMARDGRGQVVAVVGEPGRLLGDIGASGEPADVDRAEAYYREALAVATEHGMRPLIAHCHAGLAAVFRRTGRRLEFEQHVTTATTLYREMDMGYWLARATSGG